MINTSKWNDFLVKDVFQCNTTKAIKVDEINEGNIPYITRSAFNNGCSDFIAEVPGKMVKGNCITIGAEGKYAFYQDKDFLPGVKVYTLRNEFLNQNIAMFICTLLNASVFKYSYGRARILDKIMEEIIPLPVDENGNPDWKFMTDFIEELQSRERESNQNLKKSIKTINNNPLSFDTEQWDEFLINDLFECYLSQGDLKEAECANGTIPLISSGDNNNGCVKYIDENGDGKAKIFNGNCLTLDMFCKAFYQEKPFYAVSHGRINVLLPKIKFNKYIGLFIATIINHERFRFSYGRAVYSNVASNITIKLPVVNGTIDYLYIEKFIKSLPYADRI